MSIRVLICGDGNFSYSVAFAKRFPNLDLVASSYDSESELSAKYRGFTRYLQYINIVCIKPSFKKYYIKSHDYERLCGLC